MCQALLQGRGVQHGVGQSTGPVFAFTRPASGGARGAFPDAGSLIFLCPTPCALGTLAFLGHFLHNYILWQRWHKDK